MGLVAWYWLVGEDSTAEEHYPAIEALSGDRYVTAERESAACKI